MRVTLPRNFNILVTVKRSLDYTVKVRVAPGGKEVDLSPKHSMNPFDEIAVEEAIRLRDANKSHIQKIIVATIGPAKSADTLRTALAMGADSAVHITTPTSIPTSPEPLTVARTFSQLLTSPPTTSNSKPPHADLAKELADVKLVLMGKQSIDSDSSQTPQILSGLLGQWGQATFASSVKLNGEGTGVEVEREVDGGLEKVFMKLPGVVSADLRLNEPRYATLPNIMKAKKKPLSTFSYEKDFPEISLEPRLRTISLKEPEERKGGGKVENVDQLVEKLKEAGLI